jgi:hypothetical protein
MAPISKKPEAMSKGQELARWIAASLSPGAGVEDQSRVRSQVQKVVDSAVRPVLIVAVLVLGIQTTLSMSDGLDQGQIWRGVELRAANMAVNVNDAPDGTVPERLGILLRAPDVRHAVPLARAVRLSLFDSPLAVEGARNGLVPTVFVTILEPESDAMM